MAIEIFYNEHSLIQKIATLIRKIVNITEELNAHEKKEQSTKQKIAELTPKHNILEQAYKADHIKLTQEIAALTLQIEDLKKQSQEAMASMAIAEEELLRLQQEYRNLCAQIPLNWKHPSADTTIIEALSCGISGEPLFIKSQ